MSVTIPRPTQRAWSSSPIFVALCVRYYEEAGVAYADIYNPDTGIPAYRCPVLNGGLRRIKAPSAIWDGIPDTTKHPYVLVAKQSENKPCVVLGVMESAYLPEAGTDRHESTADFKNDPALTDEVLSSNGGTRTCQKDDGRLCVNAVGDVVFQLASGAVKIGYSSVEDSAALAAPLIDALLKILDAIDTLAAKQREIIVRLNAAAAASLIPAPVPVLPAPPRSSVDLDSIKSKILRLSGESE